MSVNDYIIFCKTSKQAARKVKVYLGLPLKVSTQLVDCHKSKIQFSKGILRQQTHYEHLSNHINQFIGTYLGCQNINKRRTKVDFEEIKPRLDQKLAG